MITYFPLVYIITFLYMTNTQLLITSSPYEHLEESNTIFYTYIFNRILPDYLNKMELKGLESTSSLGDLQMKQIKYTSYTILQNTPAHGGFKDNMIVFAPNYITLSFEFKVSIKASPLTSGCFNLDLYYILVKESATEDPANPGIKIPNVQVTIRKKETGFTFYSIEETDAEKVKLYKLVIQSFFFNRNKEIIQNVFNEAINEKQKEKYAKMHPITFTSTPLFGSISGKIIMKDFINFCKDTNGRRETVQCYYAGHYKKLYTNKEKDASFNKNFFMNNEREKIFINFILFEELFAEITTAKPKSILKNDALPITQQEFNVSYLRLFFEIGDYAPGTLFEVESQIESIALDTELSLIPIGIAMIKNSIMLNNDQKTIVAKFTIKISFDIELISKIAKINPCAKNIKLLSVSDIELTKAINAEKLISEIGSVLNKINANTQGCLIDNYLNLNNYLKYIEKTEIGYRGIYIEGEQMFNLAK